MRNKVDIRMRHMVNAYIAMFMVYYLQGSLYAMGGIVSRLILAVLMIVSLYLFVASNMQRSLPKPLKVLSVLIIAWTVYGLVPMVTGTQHLRYTVNSFDYLKHIYLALLPIYSFYFFSYKGWLTEDMLRKWFPVFLIVAITCYYANQNLVYQEIVAAGSSREEFTNNAGYTLLSLMTLIPLFYRKPILQYIFFAIIIFYVLSGFKRGAIISGAICFIWLIFHSAKENEKDKRNVVNQTFIRFLLTIVVVVGAIYFVQNILQTSDYFNVRLNDTLEGDSSGRDELFSFFFHHFINESNALKFLFGNGAYGTILLYFNGAHNDWLEIAIDNGILILIVYAFFWFTLIKSFFEGRRNSVSNIMLGAFIIIYFLVTLYSMFFNNLPIYASCALGFTLANYEYKAKQIK